MTVIEQCAEAMRVLKPELTDDSPNWEKVLSERCAECCLAKFAQLALSPEMVRKITWGCPPHIGFGATLAVLESLFRATAVST
jgi:hypothetical protein